MEKLDHKLTIFVGDIHESLSIIAKSHNSSAILIDHANYQKFVESTLAQDTTVYTSLGDLPKDLKIVYDILILADQIIYCPPTVWSDSKVIDFADPGNCVHGLTEVLLQLLPNSVEVKNLNPKIYDPNPLVDLRKTESEQLWIAGCSISHGVGVDNASRYGQLLANELNLPCSFLTKPGSAIDWAADQILRSDIRENDLVVWGLTNPERLTYFHNNTLLNITLKSYEVYPEYQKIVDQKNLFTHQTLYTHFYAIQKVINYCNKINARLLLVGILLGPYTFLSFLKSQKNYVHIEYPTLSCDYNILTSFIDLGTDSVHPGTKQHQQYKEIILKHI